MCNFIMIMILSVTAYNDRGDGLGIDHSYSKYFRRPRVRTARLASLLGLTVMPCWWRCIFWQQLAERTAGSSMGSPME